MACLTSDFDAYIVGLPRQRSKWEMEDSAITFKGGLVQVSDTGVYCVRATAGQTGTIVGRQTKATVATDTGVTSEIEEGDIFLHSGAGIVASYIGKKVYALDDNTVGTAVSGNACAGILLAIENGGCVVRCTLEANL